MIHNFDYLFFSMKFCYKYSYGSDVFIDHSKAINIFEFLVDLFGSCKKFYPPSTNARTFYTNLIIGRKERKVEFNVIIFFFFKAPYVDILMKIVKLRFFKTWLTDLRSELKHWIIASINIISLYSLLPCWLLNYNSGSPVVRIISDVFFCFSFIFND